MEYVAKINKEGERIYRICNSGGDPLATLEIRNTEDKNYVRYLKGDEIHNYVGLYGIARENYCIATDPKYWNIYNCILDFVGCDHEPNAMLDSNGTIFNFYASDFDNLRDLHCLGGLLVHTNSYYIETNGVLVLTGPYAGIPIIQYIYNVDYKRLNGVLAKFKVLGNRK